MQGPIRILQYVRVLDNGGIEKFIFNYLSKMDRSQVNFDFLLTRDQKESYEDELTRLNCKKDIVQLKLTRIPLFRCIESYFKLKQYFKAHDYRIVHFQSVGETIGGAFSILAAKHAGVPVRIVHGHSAVYERESIIRRILQALGRKAHMAWGTHWFACSKEAALLSFGEAACAQGKITYIHNAIDSFMFRFSEEDRHLIRKELGLEDKFIIGNVGRMTLPKNHLFMVDILKRILALKPNAVLLFVGGHSTEHTGYEEKVHDYVGKMGVEDKVIFTGERKDANKLLNAMDVFLFPSLWEGLGIVAVEAQANGLPVVASTRVPIDTKLTDLIQYIDLDKSAQYWSDIIAGYDLCGDRDSRCQEIIDEGYDLSSESRKLTGLYIDFYNDTI